MGILYKLYSLYLEEECHLLDLKLLSSLIEDDANYSSQIAKLCHNLYNKNCVTEEEKTTLVDTLKRAVCMEKPSIYLHEPQYAT
eukprot:Em0018g461a